MKKTILVSCLLLISLCNSYGQWYKKQYEVTDINYLSKEQLEESLKYSKKSLGTSGIVAGIGGLGIVAGILTLHWGLGEDPSFIAELLGSEIMGRIYMLIGAGVLVGGSIACLAYLGRIGRIKSVINRNFPSVGSLNISPAIIFNSYTRSCCPAVTLTYNF